MSPRQILLGTALLLMLGGLIFGLVPRSVDGGAIDCGSVFQPDRSAGDISDGIAGTDFNAQCESKIADAKPYSLGALGLAGIAFIVAFVASPTPMGSKPNI